MNPDDAKSADAGLVAYIAGWGFSGRHFLSPEDWIQGRRSPDEVKAEAKILPARLKRRASVATRMVCDAFSQAVEMAEGKPERVQLVFSSAWGELETTFYLLSMMHQGDGRLSPAAFHNSVHNTSIGYLSIVEKNREAATAIAAGKDSLAMGVLESIAMLNRSGEDVVLLLCDESLPTPLDPENRSESIAYACLFTSDESRARKKIALSYNESLSPSSSADYRVPMGSCAHEVLAPFHRACICEGNSTLVLDELGARAWWARVSEVRHED